MHDPPSIRQFNPHFVIPAGTQVVLKEPLPVLEAGDYTKSAGAVGVVLECPAEAQGGYLVQFTCGRTVRATFVQLSLRRREIDDEIGAVTTSMLPYVIYRCQTGSHAYGLASEQSDDDIRGVFLPPADLHWSLAELPGQVESIIAGDDVVYWEIEKFLRLALKANPNVLELLWTPCVLHATPIGHQLRELRNAFLSRHIYKTYSGYVLSQFRRMSSAEAKGKGYKPKHAMHLIRLLHAGIAALQTHEIRVDVSELREELLTIKQGGLPFEEVRRQALALDETFRLEYERTTLPHQPDVAAVDAFLIEARRSMVAAP